MSKPNSRLASVAFEVLALAREMLRIPAAFYMRAAEAAGRWVLAAWLVVWPWLVRAWELAVAWYTVAQHVVTPGRAAIGVAVAAAVGLGASQFADYSSVSIGTDDYAGVEAVVAAPDTGAKSAGSAHSWVGLPLAALALAVIAVSLRRWKLARLLPAIGAAVVAISLFVDRPKGLDEGNAALAYESVEATLLAGFWAQLACGVVLCLVAPVITAHLRPLRPGEPGRGQTPETSKRVVPPHQGSDPAHAGART